MEVITHKTEQSIIRLSVYRQWMIFIIFCSGCFDLDMTIDQIMLSGVVTTYALYIMYMKSIYQGQNQSQG